MADEPNNIDEIAKPLWGMAQRVGMRIAEMPLEKRAHAFAIAERALREAAQASGMAGAQAEGLIKLQMEAIRGMVTNIDVGGSPKGGNA